MSEETAVAEFSADTKEMGDKIAEMTLKQAKELSDYLKDVSWHRARRRWWRGDDGSRRRMAARKPKLQDRIRCRHDRLWRQEAERGQGRQELDRCFADGIQEDGRSRVRQP